MKHLPTGILLGLLLLTGGCSNAPKEENSTQQKQPESQITTQPDKTDKLPKTTDNTAQQSSFSAEAVYKSKCASCHGPYARKHALNKSKVINGWSVAKLEEALYGYKEGTYGGSMKTVMQGQVKSYSKKQLEALATYIARIPTI